VGIDLTAADARVFPLIEVTRAELAEIVGGEIAKVEPVDGGLTNTIHRVTIADGTRFGVKHYAGGRDWFDTELTTLTLLHGTIPVPEVVHVDERRQVIVYRWIEGITLHDLRKQGHHEAYAQMAEPLGRILAWLARGDATEPFELTSILERCYAQLTNGRARARIGEPTADALLKAMEAAEPQMAWGSVCLSHGDLGHRNVVVYRAGERWRVNGIIDWETATTCTPLADIGSLFRYPERHDAAFRAAFARGYRGAGGELPEDWALTARLVDVSWLVDVLDEEREMPNVFADCRRLVARLVAEVVARG